MTLTRKALLLMALAALAAGDVVPDHAPGGPAFRLCIYCDARSYIW